MQHLNFLQNFKFLEIIIATKFDWSLIPRNSVKFRERLTKNSAKLERISRDIRNLFWSFLKIQKQNNAQMQTTSNYESLQNSRNCIRNIVWRHSLFTIFSRETTFLTSAFGGLRESHPLSLHPRARFLKKKKKRKKKVRVQFLKELSNYAAFAFLLLLSREHVLRSSPLRLLSSEMQVHFIFSLKPSPRHFRTRVHNCFLRPVYLAWSAPSFIAHRNGL